MDDYTNRFRQGLAANQPDWKSAQEQEAINEWNPNTPPVLVNKGTFQTTGGGLPQFRATGGTSGGSILFTVDPVTGNITISGPLIANLILNLGTIQNTAIAGTSAITGTVTNFSLINNGTWNTGTFGSPVITGGSWATGTLTGAVLGTPNVTGGTMNNAFFGTPQTAGGTIGTPVISGIPTFVSNAGSGTLVADGQLQIQTFGGSALLAIRLGTTTYKFTPSGTY